jgi:hypothetical protein
MSANRSARLRHYNSFDHKNMHENSYQTVLKIGKETQKRTVHCSASHRYSTTAVSMGCSSKNPEGLKEFIADNADPISIVPT